MFRLALFPIKRERLSGNLCQAIELRLRHQHILPYALRMVRLLLGQIDQIAEGLQGIVHLMNDGARIAAGDRQPFASRRDSSAIRRRSRNCSCVSCLLAKKNSLTGIKSRQRRPVCLYDNSLPLYSEGKSEPVVGWTGGLRL